ncbi:MAG: biopolymer transporter ExbD, partial [Ferruginibacter sp.]|nr:biopolymer transporter ExbD [Ferruginibacter sp.]
MPKVKIPRKSTTIDMTAMCDVAFLLLSFFILATKQKPPEALSVTTPSSVSSKAVPDKSIMITLTKDVKAFLEMGEETRKSELLENINLVKNLGLTDAELTKWNKTQFIGLPLNQIKSSLSKSEIPASRMPGIPLDSANNEMIDWVKSISNAYAGTDQNELQNLLLVKGDGQALYPS